MKKYYIYYFVGGFTDTYLKREIESNKELFFDGERMYFSRRYDNQIERVYGPFENEEDPLLDIVISSRKSYIMEVKDND